MTTDDTALRRAALSVINCWNKYYDHPSIATHSQLRDAMVELGKAAT